MVRAMDTLAKRVRYLRESAGIGQREADRLAGIVRGFSGSLEREEVAEPTASRLAALAGVYGVAVEWLLTGKGETPSPRAVAIASSNRHSFLSGVAL